MTLHRQRAEGHIDVIVLLLGRKELPRGLLRTELTRAGISPEEFIAALR